MRDGYINGVPCWIDTTQPDPDSAGEFYAGLFGWQLEDVMPPGTPVKYLMGTLNGGYVAAVSSPAPGAPPVAAWNTYVWVDSADDTVAKARAAGGSVLTEPFDVMDSGRMAVVADPEGAVVGLWQANQHKGAQVVNEPGSLNFNDLHTRDVEAAKAFYGAVFGWEVLDLGGGLMWTLPGYCDFLERSDPGIRERMASVSAPEGFEDVVASIAPIAADDADAPARWGVTFAVADADATAARATELGGQVVAGPYDAPWVRTAIIADPAGAVFTASQFVPENATLGQEAGAASSGS